MHAIFQSALCVQLCVLITHAKMLSTSPITSLQELALYSDTCMHHTMLQIVFHPVSARLAKANVMLRSWVDCRGH